MIWNIDKKWSNDLEVHFVFWYYLYSSTSTRMLLTWKFILVLPWFHLSQTMPHPIFYSNGIPLLMVISRVLYSISSGAGSGFIPYHSLELPRSWLYSPIIRAVVLYVFPFFWWQYWSYVCSDACSVFLAVLSNILLPGDVLGSIRRSVILRRIHRIV